MLVTRFAPSPTGYLHLGHAFSAIAAFNAAAAAGGRFLLRIEDIDAARRRPEFEAAIYEDLAWLGLRWEEPVRRQSEHIDRYRGAIDALRARGLVYRCFKTRKDVAAEIARAPHLAAGGPEGPQYIGAPLPEKEERALLDQGADFAWRLSLAQARKALGSEFDTLRVNVENNDVVSKRPARPDIFGDVILGRKDSGVSYHLASALDDADQGVTHIVRGRDLEAAADLHRLLQALLDLPPPVYRHHRLIGDASGRRLAKRDRAETIRSLREAGLTPRKVRLRAERAPDAWR